MPSHETEPEIHAGSDTSTDESHAGLRVTATVSRDEAVNQELATIAGFIRLLGEQDEATARTTEDEIVRRCTKQMSNPRAVAIILALPLLKLLGIAIRNNDRNRCVELIGHLRGPSYSLDPRTKEWLLHCSVIPLAAGDLRGFLDHVLAMKTDDVVVEK